MRVMKASNTSLVSVRPRHSPCFLGRISSRVLKRVHENSDETPVASRLTSEVHLFFVAGKDVGLRRQRASRPPGPSLLAPNTRQILVSLMRLRDMGDSGYVGWCG